MPEAKKKSKAEKKKNFGAGLGRRLYPLAVGIADRYVTLKTGFRREKAAIGDIEGPIIICINHSFAYDPIVTAGIMPKRQLSFIASEHILRTPWGRMLGWLSPIIPHGKGSKTNRTALTAIKRVRKGASIFIAPEGEQTWTGAPMPVMPFIGKMIKASGATLVTYVMEGAYLARPRWADNPRKGPVYGHPVGIYSPGKLASMSEAEIEEIIARDIRFDTWEWQKSRPGGPASFRPRKGGPADGIERVLFSCPGCGRIGALASSGHDIKCAGCGFKIRMADTGFFEEPSPFENAAEWEASDRKRLAEVMEEAAAAGAYREIFADDGISLFRINVDHTDDKIYEGRLSLVYEDGTFALKAGTNAFRLADITAMSMILAGRIVFSDKNGYYELRSSKGSRINLRKYTIARDILLKEKKEEKEGTDIGLFSSES